MRFVFLEKHLYASSYALMRIAFDAYVRGMWLANCATEEQVQKFLKGEKMKEMNKIQTLVDGIE